MNPLKKDQIEQFFELRDKLDRLSPSERKKQIDGLADRSVARLLEFAFDEPISFRGLKRGDKIGVCTLDERLGSGGCGEVWRAEQDHAGGRRKVAVKLVRPDHLRGPDAADFLKVFRREIAVLAELEVAGVIRLYDSGVSTLPASNCEFPFLVMEYVDGKPITEALRGRGIHDQIECFRKVCQAVQSAHNTGSGIFHLDLKPSNILVKEFHGNLTPFVLDFGLAQKFDPVRPFAGENFGKGTLPYMAPEQLDPILDGNHFCTDVHALGVVLFQILTGRLPYANVTGRPSALVKEICDCPRKKLRDEARHPPIGVTAEQWGNLDAVIARAISVEKKERFQSPGDFAAALARWGEPPARDPVRPYRQHLVDLCRFVPLRGVQKEEDRRRGDPQKEPDDPDKRVELERIFVDLNTTSRVEPEILEMVDKRRRERDLKRLLDGGQDDTSRKTRDLERFLSGQHDDVKPLTALQAAADEENRHVVIHGPPGCGKSTFLRFLVLGLARCGLGDQNLWKTRLARWPEHEAMLLPIRIELRHFAAWLHDQGIIQPEPCHIWDHFKDHISQLEQKESWTGVVEGIETCVRQHLAIFILDGLDEVPGEKNKLLVRQCIEAFANGVLGKDARIIVTCRTRSYEADYKGQSLRLQHPRKHGPATADFWPAYELDLFDDKQIKRFVKAWYEALVEIEADELDAASAKKRIDNLTSTILAPHRRELRKLASYPLLLTVISHLHSSDPNMELPNNRAKLFDDLIDLLLHRWSDRNRGAVVPDNRPTLNVAVSETLGDLLDKIPDYSKEEFIQFLAELACRTYRGGEKGEHALISEHDLRDGLMNLHPDPDTPNGAAWAQRVMNFIQYRAGLLNSPNGVDYDFPHSLLHEYLAAFHLTRQRHFAEVLASKVTPDGNWDEVVRLAAGHFVFVRKEARDAIDLANELCAPFDSRGHDPVPELDWRRVALAGDVLAEMGQSRVQRTAGGRACREQVRELIVELLEADALPPRDRARAGRDLATLNDTRDGVGLSEDGLPDFAWSVELKAGDFELAENHETIPVPHPYQISLYPVTVAQFQAFVDQGGYRDDGSEADTKRLRRWWGKEGLEWKRENQIDGPEDYDPEFQTPNHPRVGVSWMEANAFCRWATETLKSDQVIRLPHEAEWEQAARWNKNKNKGEADDRRYPWGDTKDEELPQRCNMSKSGIGHTSAVGLFPTGVADCGAFDLSGNVWEWCSNWYDKDEVSRAVRGGSWILGPPVYFACAFRLSVRPVYRDRDLGFRVVLCSG